MLLKANLHFHTKDDHHHLIKYDSFEGIDYASKLGFEVLAITCHQKLIFSEDLKKYAESKNILLIPGVEINIGENKKEGRHLLILNCNSDAEKIKTFKDLEKYKKRNSNIFIIAPHPYFPGLGFKQSLMEYTEKYFYLFDAIEHSWFYSNMLNKNIKAEKQARKKNLPFIATSDTHFPDFLDTDYCLIEAEEKNIPSVFKAIRKNKFKNVTRAKKLFSEMFLTQLSFTIRDSCRHFKKPKNKLP